MMLKISVSVLLLQYNSLGRVFIDYRCSVLVPNDVFQTDTALGSLVSLLCSLPCRVHGLYFGN